MIDPIVKELPEFIVRVKLPSIDSFPCCDSESAKIFSVNGGKSI